MVKQTINKGKALIKFLHDKGVWLVTLIGVMAVLSKPISKGLNYTREIYEVAKILPSFRDDFADMMDELIVIKGLLKALMIPVDDRDYGAYINDKLIEVQIMKVPNGNDCYIFVEDGNTGVYEARWNDTMQKWTFVNFSGSYQLAYEIEIQRILH